MYQAEVFGALLKVYGRGCDPAAPLQPSSPLLLSCTDGRIHYWRGSLNTFGRNKQNRQTCIKCCVIYIEKWIISLALTPVRGRTRVLSTSSRAFDHKNTLTLKIPPIKEYIFTLWSLINHTKWHYKSNKTVMEEKKDPKLNCTSSVRLSQMCSAKP